MAIRSGTGGLKYPLPANTQAQQSIAAASSGGSAAASAYGANRSFAANKMRVQADLANSAADRNYRAQAQMSEQNFRAQQQFYDRENQKGSQLEAQRFSAEQQDQRLQNAREMQWQGQYFDAEQNRQQQQFTTQRDQTRFEQDQAAFEAQRDAGIQDAIQKGQLELSVEDQMRLKKLESGRAYMKDMDPAQREEFERRFAEEERRILRGAKPPQGPSASGQYNKGLVYVGPDGRAYDEPGAGRTPGRVNEKGEFTPTVQQPDTTEMNQDIYKDAQGILKEANADGSNKYSNFQSAYEESLKRRRASGLPTPEQAPEAPADPAKQPSASSTAKSGTDAAPEAPMVQPAGMANSVVQRSGGDVPPVQTMQETLPGNPNYQAPTGPATSTLPTTPDSGKGVVATPVTGAPPSPGQTWQGPQIPGQAPAIPGFPQGSVMGSDGTIRLPDGRVIRRKGQ